MTFTHCTRCHDPIVKRPGGGVALVHFYRTSKRLENLCGDCVRREGELADAAAARADAEAERSGV